MDTHSPLKLNLSPLTFIPSLLKHQNPNGSSPSSMRHLTPLRLNRFNLNYFHRRKIIHHHNPNSLFQIIKPVSLARSPPMAEVERAEKSENQPEEREKKPPKELPTPPEKPEPGDCCGSGCVRCVWDVYYDELEDYNQLLKQFNSQSPSNS